MKIKTIFILLLVVALLSGCVYSPKNYDIVATTLPVFDFTSALCQGTDLSVGRLVNENVACLHDYTLQVSQMQMIERAQIVVMSGAGFEEFLDDVLQNSSNIIDASLNTHIHESGHEASSHDHNSHGHNHDPHIWLSPENAAIMLKNISDNLISTYPQYSDIFRKNYEETLQQLVDLQAYGISQLSDLNNRQLITFHDGFAYFAESFDLTILESVEEESGSEASAQEIIHLVELVEHYRIPAIFVERSGSDACAEIIHSETGAEIYILDMAMAGDSYFAAMYHNINTVKEALG